MNLSKKNIVIIGPAHPLRGGLASYNERLAREFQNQGHIVTIYTFSLQYPGFLFPGTTQYSLEPSPKDLSIKICINSINPFNWFRVGNEIKNLRPDIVVVRYWLPFMGPCLGRILRSIKKNKFSKVICIADNVIPHEKRIGDNLFTKYFVKPVDGFVTMSQKVLSDLKYFEKNTPSCFTPHPLYDNFGDIVSKQDSKKYLNIPDQLQLFLFFGFIRKYKGLDLLFEAIKVYKEHPSFNPNVKFLIAGEFYEDRKPYDDLIDKLGIRDLLILKTTFIPDSEIKYYLCAAEAVIQPYKNATQSGVTPLAYHFNIPMIVTNVGGLPDLVPDKKAGLIAEPNPKDIADKIVSFLAAGSDVFLPGLKEEKKKYSWQIMTQQIFNLSQ